MLVKDLEKSFEFVNKKVLISASVGEKYREIEEVGRGSYGSVFKARDLSSNFPREVALKRFNPSKNEGISVSALKEIAYLRRGAGSNVVELLDVVFKESDNICYIVSVMEYMEYDLLGLAASKVVFPLPSVKFIFGEIVKGVACLHANKIFHRDLKSANILMNRAREVKVADLGMSEFFIENDLSHSKRLRLLISQKHEAIRTAAGCVAKASSLSAEETEGEPRSSSEPPKKCNSVSGLFAATHKSRVFYREATTLLYRAPEQMLKVASGYDQRADVWSLGCILMELLLGKPFFKQARDSQHLLRLLTRLYGEQAFRDYAEAWASPEFKAVAKEWRDKTLSDYLVESKFDEPTIDLILKLLALDPAHRIDVFDILSHRFFDELQKKDELDEFPNKFPPTSFRVSRAPGESSAGAEAQADGGRRATEARSRPALGGRPAD